ncbi:MAG: hypothetical protein HY864_07100 [Chloroflexi bacterium]|nr:hypothetical protein [Chloroflexota bacterium]
MKKTAKRSDFVRIFGLADADVEYRNKWRTLAGGAVWLVLSGLTMILTLIGVKERLHIAIVIGMSLLKYLPLLMVVYAASRIKAAHYLDDIYELQNEDLASEFLEEVTFGYGRERITINEGRIAEKDEKSSLILIGGPGYIQVNLDSVALLEKVNGDPEVIFPRNESWKLGRFERIREIGKSDEAGKREYAIINLRDLFIRDLTVKSRTKDGIPLGAHGIKVMFSLLRRGTARDEKTLGDAYLFEEDAVKSLVYNQTIITPSSIIPPGIPFPWDTTVVPLIISEMENLITSRTLSEILATISKKEVESAASNDQTIAQMKIDMTGQYSAVNDRETSNEQTRSDTPNFESRSKITAQFFSREFKQKAAKIGVNIEWIDVGTWQLPDTLILDKHKEAWNLARENAKNRARVENSGRQMETKEIIKLVYNVVIANYDKGIAPPITSAKDKGLESTVTFNIDSRSESHKDGRKKPTAIAQEILKAFRMELIAGKTKLEADGRPLDLKAEELAAIKKALHNITHLVPPHYVKPS